MFATKDRESIIYYCIFSLIWHNQWLYIVCWVYLLLNYSLFIYIDVIIKYNFFFKIMFLLINICLNISIFYVCLIIRSIQYFGYTDKNKNVILVYYVPLRADSKWHIVCGWFFPKSIFFNDLCTSTRRFIKKKKSIKSHNLNWTFLVLHNSYNKTLLVSFFYWII